jgi:hypothetical protein
MADPRLYQIGTLASLLVYGMGWLDFDITLGRVALLLTTVIATQWIGDRLAGGPPFGLSARSALISGLSLCLLLRTNRSELAILAAIFVIGGKFLFRVDGKHVFNPTNGGIVAMLLITNQVCRRAGVRRRSSPSARLRGLARRHRAARSDVTHAFIAATARPVRPVVCLGGALATPCTGWRRRCCSFSRSPIRKRRPTLAWARVVRRARGVRRVRAFRFHERTASCGRSPAARRWCRSSIASRPDCVTCGRPLFATR